MRRCILTIPIMLLAVSSIFAGPAPLGASEAYDYSTVLGDAVEQCPLVEHQQYIDLMTNIYFRHGQPPIGCKPWLGDTQIAEQTLAAYQQLKSQFPVIQTEWTSDSLTIHRPSPPIPAARGLRRFVMVEIANRTAAPQTLAASLDEFSTGSQTFVTIPPGATRGYFRGLVADDKATSAQLKVTDKTAVRQVSVPLSLSAPAIIRGTLVEGETGEVFPGRVHVLGSDHALRHAPRFAGNKTLSEKQILTVLGWGRFYKLPFFYSDGHFEMAVPPGETKLTLERGFEHPLVSETITLQPGETRDVTLTSRREINMRESGWISGDTHVHWAKNWWNENEDIDLLGLVQRAEDLRVANNLTLRHHNPPMAEFIAPTQFPMGPIPGHDGKDYYIQMAEEYRNEGFYGHLVFLNIKKLIQPISTGAGILGPGAIDYPTNRQAILNAHAQGGISIEAHGMHGEVPVNIIDGVCDSLDQINPEDYYQVLDAGFRLPLSNGSDHPARVAGCVRVYVKIDGEFTYQRWIDGIRARRTFTTSGPLLFLTVNGKEIGGEVRVKKGDMLKVRARVWSRFPVGQFQVVSGGKVLKELTLDQTSGTIELDLPAEESCWFVARCSPQPNMFNALAASNVAHTSAIYVIVDGQPIFKAEAAAAFAKRMHEHAERIREKGLFENDAQRQEAVGVVRKGAAAYDHLVEKYK